MRMRVTSSSCGVKDMGWVQNKSCGILRIAVNRKDNSEGWPRMNEALVLRNHASGGAQNSSDV